MIFLAALHRLTSISRGTLIVAAVGVLLDRSWVWWYKKIDPGFVVVPVVSFHRLEFFSSRSARRHGGRFYYRLVVELGAACHQLVSGVASGWWQPPGGGFSPIVTLSLQLLEKI